MNIEDEIKIISVKFGISESEIKKVIGYKKDEKPTRKRPTDLTDKKKSLQEIDNKNQKLEVAFKKNHQYIFTQDGYKKLLEKIDDIKSRISVIGKEIGESCDESETFHDNFDYEEGTRQQFMWTKELRKFLVMKSKARIVSSDESPDSIVSVGKEITVEDVLTKEMKTFK
jgi:hypothetical protein